MGLLRSSHGNPGLRPGPPRRFRGRRGLRVETWLAGLVAAALIGLFIQNGVGAGQIRIAAGPTTLEDAAPPAFSSPSRIVVVDGDTIRIPGEPKRIRLVGFNAPETRDPQCAGEGALGDRATRRLKELVSSRRTDLTKVPCACAPGTEGTDRCNYGRSCGILRVDGRDVGDILIAEGLATPFRCGASSCPRTPRPWCG
jgi:endonuclease YncB( thermonuclease family)